MAYLFILILVISLIAGCLLQQFEKENGEEAREKKIWISIEGSLQDKGLEVAMCFITCFIIFHVFLLV